MQKHVGIASTPNAQRDDASLSFSLWVKSLLGRVSVRQISSAENTLLKILGENWLYTNTGRTAINLILKAYAVSKGDEVVIQPFTCAAVTEAVINADAKPVFCDIDRSNLNFDIAKLEKCVTKKTKAIIIQNTFGYVPDLMKINKLVKNVSEEICIILDLAHTIEPNRDAELIEKYADAAIYSFGQDKAASCTQGGAVYVKNADKRKNLENLYFSLPDQARKKTLNMVAHPFLWSIINKLYIFPTSKVSLGKIVLFFMKILGLTGNVSTEKFSACRLADQQKVMLANQLMKIENMNRHRKKLAQIYRNEIKNANIEIPKSFNVEDEIALLRFPIFVHEPEIVRAEFRKQNIIIGNWYNNPIYPKGTDFTKYNYETGSCPVAEEICAKIINLPLGVNTSEEMAKKIALILNNLSLK